MGKPCYSGPNPVKDEERYAIWRWAKENGGDAGMPFEKLHDSINQFFFGGQAKPEWINDILSGRKTPFRATANDLWRKQYNRNAIVQQAAQLSQRAALGPLGRFVQSVRYVPRSLSVVGHFGVFPVTHAGDLMLRPTSWGTFIKGTMRAYRGSFSSAYAARMLDTMMHRDPLYDLALRSGVDVGPKSHPVGLIANTGKKTGYMGASARSWDMLTVMRYELWKKAVGKYLKPGMTEADALDFGKQFADWSNHATGSAKGPIADIGGGTLFGPKLTQSKLSRISTDPLKTAETFLDWRNATPGEKAVAWTRLSGSVQYVATGLGFLALNQGVLQAFGQKDKINWSDPSKGDYMSFKGGGITGYIPGLHTELRTVAKILSLWYTDSRVAGKRKPVVQNPALHGDSKYTGTAKILGQYAMAKLEPGIQRGLEIGMGENYAGRPLPWSKDKGTEKKPRMSAGEYAGSVGPIPLEGPIGYVYDQLKKNGASAMDAHAIVKGLLIFGGGLPGFHVKEDYNATKD